MTLLLFFFILITTVNNTGAQPDLCDEKIKSVFFIQEGEKFSYPILHLNANETLTLRFDYLSDVPEDFSYKIQHLSADYKVDNSLHNEYAQGFEINRIRNRKHSVNTLYSYNHYWLSFPNEDVKFLTSGNYLISVFPDGQPDKPMLQKVFYVVEGGSSIDARVLKSMGTDLGDTHQHIEMSVTPDRQFAGNIEENVKVTVLQNMRYDNMLQFPKPTRSNGTSMVFDDMELYNFEGGTEYRHFEMKSLRYESPGIERTDYISPYYHVFLKAEKERPFEKYQFDRDINGQYAIQRDRSYDTNIEADYLYVHFKLDIPKPILDGNIYIVGALTGQQLNKQSKLEYNFDNNYYEKKMLLKQGYYNYLYIYKGMDNVSSTSYIEGSHFETENEYCIFVYFCPNGSRMHRLIGQRFVNSR